MATNGFDDYPVNRQLLVSLTMEEATGAVTLDRARPHRELALNGPPTWTQVPNNLGVLNFDGASDYLDCPAADTGDLDFTTEDYSIVVWVNHNAVGLMVPKIVVGRYEIDDVTLINNTGWEVYLETNGPDYLELRHHHGSYGTWANQRDGCFSTGWVTGTWNLLAITRSGLYPKHYRDGIAVAVTYGPNGIRNPDTNNRDLVVGCRFSKDTDWYSGKMWNLRIWDRELSEYDIREIFETERHWFNS